MTPVIRGLMYLGLSVRDVRLSAAWYRELLGLTVERETLRPPTAAPGWDEVLLRDPVSGLLIGLLQHSVNDGEPFSEFRTGLDHVEFEVGSMGELAQWQARLDDLGIPWSRTRPQLLTLRDPDNIQLEFFCPHH